MSIHIQLERFEGPLGLLLHLIRKEEMDIFDINIHQITRQYLEYIKAMRQLDLERAGEFVAMAATLIHIKSRMLLPQYNEEGEIVESEDPRKELIQKLLEYQKYQEVSARLYERPLVGRDQWLRGRREDFEAMGDGDIIVDENPLFSLISSYRAAVKNMKKTIHRVGGELQSIASRIAEIQHRFVVGVRVRMQDLVTQQEKARDQLLVTFLSLLELAKMGFISLFQNEVYADIYVEAKMPIDEVSISNVENYESAYREEAPNQMALDFEAFESAPAEAPVESLNEEQIADSFAREEVLLEEEDGDGAVSAKEVLVDAATDEEILEEERKIEEEEKRGVDPFFPPEGELV